MIRTQLIALLGTTAVSSITIAQEVNTPVRPQQTQEQNDCVRLVAELQRRNDPGVPVTIATAREYQRTNNVAACQTAFQRLQTAQQGQSGDQSEITVQQRAPQVTFDQAAPRVTVQQPQPQVSVQQPMPEIVVRQAAPTITVQQPQPEITVRMPRPEVSVAMPQPRVSVDQAQPQVQVVGPEQRAQVQVERAPAQVIVRPAEPVQPNIQQQGQPRVRYERTGEPRIVYQQAQGEPKVQFEQQPSGQPATEAGQQRQATPAQPEAAQERQTAARPSRTQLETAQPQAGQPDQVEQPNASPVAVADLLDLQVWNEMGQQLGDVERVVRGTDNRQYVIIGHGGFLGLGEKQIALPLQNLRYATDRLLVSGVTDAQIRAMPEVGWDDGYRDLQRNQTVQLNQSVTR